MPLLNIFFQVFFLQQIFFGLNLVSSSQVVGQHEPDVEKKGMSRYSVEMFKKSRYILGLNHVHKVLLLICHD